MKQTPNINLPILEQGDKYLKETQNEAFSVIDREIAGLNSAISVFDNVEGSIIDTKSDVETLKNETNTLKASLNDVSSNVIPNIQTSLDNNAKNEKDIFEQNYKSGLEFQRQLGVCCNTTPLDNELIIKLKNDGFKYARVSVYWYGVETTKGIYNFSKADNEINSIINNGMTPHIILFGGNTLYGENNLSILTEDGLNGWCNFVNEVVKRYKDKNIQWEIWNEPWNNSFWQPFTVTSGKYYANLVKRTYPIIKSIDKTGTVVGTSMINFDLRFSDWYELACKFGMLNYLDKVSLHYYSKNTTYPERDIQEFYDKVRQINHKYSKNNIPLIVTEGGYSVAPNGEDVVTESERSKYIPRMLLLNMINGVDGFSIYEIRSKKLDSSNSEDWFGLLNSDNSHTTSYTALIDMIKELDGYSYLERIQTNENDYILKFIDNKNNFKYAYWTVGNEHTIVLNGRECIITDTVNYLSTSEKHSLYNASSIIEINSSLRKLIDFSNLSKKYNEILQTTKCDFLFNTSTEPWFPTSLAGGSVGTAVGIGHPGIHTYLSHSTNANSGYLYRLGANTFILNGGEKTTIVFKTPSDFTNVIRRSGFFYSADITEPTNGVYLEQIGNKITGKTSNNGVKSTTVSSFTMSTNTWYRGVIEIGDNASIVYFNIFNDNGVELWGDIITTTIPSVNSGGNSVGHEDICVATTSTSQRVIGSIDYMDIYLPNSRKLV